ncbi:MAG: A/G-specific adenine glycosylase [Pseudomonadota bacterium]
MSDFADRLLHWWQDHGRHDLPWQEDRTTYRVWISEIMLQQTRVATVIPYFERFMESFPDLSSLARADLDQVLSRWTGLGYYARARNLHAAAVKCVQEHQGQLPDTAEALHALPGIGLSTANAIIAQALNQRAPILDGNVKRVLARHGGIEGWPGRSAVSKALWAASDQRTPVDRARDYTQAIMDLGATVCRSRSPVCSACPVSHDCVALRDHRIGELPGKKPKKERVERQSRFLVLRNHQGKVLLARRPPSGIWGGLWCFPEGESDPASPTGESLSRLEAKRHEFTHFRLIMRFDHLLVRQGKGLVADHEEQRWFSPSDALAKGLPRPVQAVLQELAKKQSN